MRMIFKFFLFSPVFLCNVDYIIIYRKNVAFIYYDWEMSRSRPVNI